MGDGARPDERRHFARSPNPDGAQPEAPVTKRLYLYETWPLDPDRAESFYFDKGIVEIEPDELEVIERDLRAAGHSTLITWTPVGEIVLDSVGFRAAIGRAILNNHQNDWT